MSSISFIRKVEAPDHVNFGNIPDVDMNRMLVVAGHTKKIGSSNLGSCFAICGLGETRGHQPVLALCHNSSAYAGYFREVFLDMQRRMVAKGCAPETIKVYIIGGQPASVDLHGDPVAATAVSENEMLDCVECPIEEALFRYSKNEDDPIHVALTVNGIYVSKQPLFSASGSNQDAGTPIKLVVESESDSE